MFAHKTLTLETKLKVINEVESSGPQNFVKTARSNRISIKICSDQVEKDGDDCKVENLSRKRKRNVKEEDVENASLVWLEQKNEQNGHKSMPLLRNGFELNSKMNIMQWGTVQCPSFERKGHTFPVQVGLEFYWSFCC